MSVLYVTQPDAILNKKYEAFIVSLKQEDGTWKKHSVPAQTVEQVVLMGNPQITGDALSYALELGMPVHYLSYFGKYIGTTLPGYSRNGQLRLAQYSTHCHEEKRLKLVKVIVAGKIHNQYSVLYRYGQKDNPLKQRKNQVREQTTLDQVRGIEGIAAREYFEYWSNILTESWSFIGRHHRRPSDPMNVLMNFAYGLLRIQVTAVSQRLKRYFQITPVNFGFSGLTEWGFQRTVFPLHESRVRD